MGKYKIKDTYGSSYYTDHLYIPKDLAESDFLPANHPDLTEAVAQCLKFQSDWGRIMTLKDVLIRMLREDSKVIILLPNPASSEYRSGQDLPPYVLVSGEENEPSALVFSSLARFRIYERMSNCMYYPYMVPLRVIFERILSSQAFGVFLDFEAGWELCMQLPRPLIGELIEKAGLAGKN